MYIFRSWIFSMCLTASISLMGQQSTGGYDLYASNIDASDIEEIEQSFAMEEADLLVERWQQQIDESHQLSPPDNSEFLDSLDVLRIRLMEEQLRKEGELKDTQQRIERLTSKQTELIDEVRSIVLQQDLHASAEREQEVEDIEELLVQEESLRVIEYENEISLLSQSIENTYVQTQLQRQEIDLIKARRYDVEVEIQNLEMLMEPIEAISDINE